MITKYKLAWKLLGAHTLIVISWFGLSFLPSDNPDSSIAFILMVLVGYIADFPIGMIYEKILRPLKPENISIWIGLSFAWFVILGGLYWFCIGIFINKLHQKRRLNENIS